MTTYIALFNLTDAGIKAAWIRRAGRTPPRAKAEPDYREERGLWTALA
jgi:hypothetical protein